MSIKLKFEIVVHLFFALAISRGKCSNLNPKPSPQKNAVYLKLARFWGSYAINTAKFSIRREIKLNATRRFLLLPNRLDSKTTWLPVVPLEISALLWHQIIIWKWGFGFTTYLTRSLALIRKHLKQSIKCFGAFIPLRVGYRYPKPEGGFF